MRVATSSRFVIRAWLFGAALTISTHANSDAPPTGLNSASLWKAHIEPLLTERCVKCHGGAKQKSGLDLRSIEAILKGGERGPALVPGKPDESLLFKFLHDGADPRMPPAENKPLGEEEIALIRLWIEKLPGANSLASDRVASGADWQTSNGKSERDAIAWRPPAGMPASSAINHFIEIGWKERRVKAARICDDRTFVRRAFLDLIGRIPTTEEAGVFVRNRDPRKREWLIDALMASDEYARHMREVFDVVLMERKDEKIENEREKHLWFAYLENAFRENRPWNQIVHDLILARPSAPQHRGAIWFLYERRNNAQEMAEAVAPLAFGVQVKCAQCHNHPLASEIEQKHYWGLVAAFNRSKNVETAEGIGLAESAIGGFVNYANLKKETSPAILTFLTGKTIPEDRPADNVKEEDAPEKYLVPPPKEKEKPPRPAVPKFSRREKLADVVTQENPLLARAFVNRVWAMLLGRGLVHPVDLMDSKHPPSHPELLDWLAQDFASNGYDIRRLIRTIMLTKVYQLDSRPRGSKPSPPEAFARALEKPLSAETLARSVLVATGPAPGKASRPPSSADESGVRRAFVKYFPDLFAPEYNATLQQAMFLSNNPKFHELLEARESNLVGRLVQTRDAKERVRRAFEAILGREPAADEMRESLRYLADRPIEPGAKQLVWALLASAEFQLNH
jgi:hypothetical protein